MISFGQKLRRFLLPLAVFLGVAVAHYVWSALFPEVDPAQARWASLPGAGSSSWLNHYTETQGYWLGYSYALSLAFAAAALRRYREERFCSAKTLAFGGVTLSGFLALAGCFLVGCCGSPMLLIYLSLFGAWFLPLAKPLVAVVTTLSIIGAWWWMQRRHRQVIARTEDISSSDQFTRCQSPSCQCNQSEKIRPGAFRW